MKINLIAVFILLSLRSAPAQTEKLIYHDIQTDASGKIIPWFSTEPGKAYSHVIQSVWHFWDTMRIDMNGLPYYMNHQVWMQGVDDSRGIGGDQLQMALSSWLLLYQFTGDERVKEIMKFMADYYLTHGFSSSTAEWPDIPYPYNTLIYSGIFDGDMVIGKNFTQPDKAGSLGIELTHLSDEEHILYSSSVVQEVEYKNRTGANYLSGVDNQKLKDIKLRYTTYDNRGIETIRLLEKPSKIIFEGASVSMSDNMTINSYKWQPLKKGGILRINRIKGNIVTIMD